MATVFVWISPPGHVQSLAPFFNTGHWLPDTFGTWGIYLTSYSDEPPFGCCCGPSTLGGDEFVCPYGGSIDGTGTLVAGSFSCSDPFSCQTGLSAQGSGAGYTFTNGRTETIQFRLDVTPIPICWSLTAMRNDGRFFRIHGPGRLPRKLRVPRNVKLSTCIVYEDGVFVPKNKYNVIHE